MLRTEISLIAQCLNDILGYGNYEIEVINFANVVARYERFEYTHELSKLAHCGANFKPDATKLISVESRLLFHCFTQVIFCQNMVVKM